MISEAWSVWSEYGELASRRRRRKYDQRWLILQSEAAEAKTDLNCLQVDRMSKHHQRDYNKIKARASCNGYVDIHDRRSDRNMMTAWVFGRCKQKIGNSMTLTDSMISQLRWWAHRGKPKEYEVVKYRSSWIRRVENIGQFCVSVEQNGFDISRNKHIQLHCPHCGTVRCQLLQMPI